MVVLNALGFYMVKTTLFAIRRFRNAEKETGAERRPVIVSGIVSGDTPVSYWLILSPVPVPSNSFVSLCES